VDTPLRTYRRAPPAGTFAVGWQVLRFYRDLADTPNHPQAFPQGVAQLAGTDVLTIGN
jgi:hypothetical protein